MADIIEEARAMLAQATPGLWIVGVDRIWSNECDESVCEFPKLRSVSRAGQQAYRNAVFIAAAPRLLAALADECERLRAENARLREAMPDDQDVARMRRCIMQAIDTTEAETINGAHRAIVRIEAAKGVR